MKSSGFFKRSLIGLLIVMMVPFGALSQETAPSGQGFSQAELDQMLAPIALYPDALLAQVLVAATFPGQVTEADHWLKRNANLSKDRLNDAMDTMEWDLSVKALAPFPQVLAMMADQAAWTQRLGQAFLAQEPDVMASVQRLRSKAYAAGNLKESAEQQVVVKGETIEIAPVNPEVVYVPRYDPVVVYGAWWWPAYPPLVYYPAFPVVDVAVGVFGFWGAVAVGPVWGWGWGSWNWGGGSMNVNVNRNVNINRNTNINRNFNTSDARNVAGGRGGAGRGTGNANRGGSTSRGAGSAGRGGTGGTGGRGTGNVGGGGSRGTGGRGTGNVGSGGSRGSGARSSGSRSSSMRSGGGSRSSGARSGGARSSSMRSGGGSRSSGARSGGARSSSMRSGGGSRSSGARSGGARSGGGARGGGGARSGGGARGGGGGRRR